ncbi:MAG: glycogen debranching enzyme N-terminal domain-containing protein [Pirellulales bacterium]
MHYRLERARGYEYEGEVWSPGYFRVDLEEGEEAVLVGSTEDWDTVLAVNPEAIFHSERQRRERLLCQAGVTHGDPFQQELVLAADQFIIRPNTAHGRPRRGAGRRRRRAYGHRRLSLVHGLGTRHDDQPRRAHALDRSS